MSSHLQFHFVSFLVGVSFQQDGRRLWYFGRVTYTSLSFRFVTGPRLLLSLFAIFRRIAGLEFKIKVNLKQTLNIS